MIDHHKELPVALGLLTFFQEPFTLLGSVSSTVEGTHSLLPAGNLKKQVDSPDHY